jgi:hypothetical protein
MRFRTWCPTCGETGVALSDSAESVPRCPACGHRFVLSALSGDEPILRGRDGDQLILSWLAEPLESAAAPSAATAACSACGYEGPMECDAAREHCVCPACFTPQTLGHGSIPTDSVECPSCRQSIELSVLDRGTTVICPRCKYFLGCLQPREKRTYRNFWSRS